MHIFFHKKSPNYALREVFTQNPLPGTGNFQKRQKTHGKIRIFLFLDYAFSGHAILELSKKTEKYRAKPRLQKGLLKLKMKGAIFRPEQLSHFFRLLPTRLLFRNPLQ